MNENLELINKAIEHVLKDMAEGNFITKYTIGNTTIEKPSSIELLKELENIKKRYIKSKYPNSIQYVFS